MPPLAFRVPVHVRTPESDSPVQVRVVHVSVPVSVSPVHVMFCRLVVPWTVRFWVTWLVEITVLKDPVPPVNVPAMDRLLTEVLPLPFTKNGELVPLNTWKPPPEVAMNPALAETAPEVRVFVFTLLAETAAAETEPKVPVLDTAMEFADALVELTDPKLPSPPTARVFAIRFVKVPVAPVMPAKQLTGPWKDAMAPEFVTRVLVASMLVAVMVLVAYMDGAVRLPFRRVRFPSRLLFTEP